MITDPTFVSPCDINQTFNCTQVYLSRFGTVRGVPVALGGVIWFALVALIAAFARPKAADEAAADATGGYLFALSTIGLAVILYLGYNSFFVLKTACLLCMGTYVCVIGIFIASGLTRSVSVSRLPARLGRDLKAIIVRPTALLIAILYLAGAASVVAFFPKEGSVHPAPPAAQVPENIEQAFTNAWDQQPRVDLGIAPDGAKVVVVKFNDWMCPACKAYHQAYQPVLDRIEQAHPGAVKYVLKDWPWNSSCNFTVPQTFQGHEGSCDAAVAVRLARDRAKADEMIAWLFDNQQRLIDLGRTGGGAPEAIQAHVAEALGIKDFASAAAPKLTDIRRDVADGSALQIHSTPTYFVNGVLAQSQEGSLPPQYFELAITHELSKAGIK